MPQRDIIGGRGALYKRRVYEDLEQALKAMGLTPTPPPTLPVVVTLPDGSCARLSLAGQHGRVKVEQY